MSIALLGLLALAAQGPAGLRLGMAVAAIEGRAPSASELEQAMVDTVEGYTGVSLIKSEELFVLAGESPLVCGPDIDCLELHFRRADADAGLLVVLTAEGENTQLDWRLISVHERRILARDRALLSQETGMRAQLADVFAEVMQALELERAACVQISAEPADSTLVQIVQAGETRASGIGRHCMPAGEYEVLASREGYVTSRQLVALEAGHTTAAHLELERVRRAWYQSPWFWGVVGAVVIGSAVTAGVVVATGGADCVCVGEPDEPCPPCP